MLNIFRFVMMFLFIVVYETFVYLKKIYKAPTTTIRVIRIAKIINKLEKENNK